MQQISAFSSVNKRLCRIFLATVFMLLMVDANAAQYYRYKDNTGSTVMSLTIPPEYVAKGYEILNDKGRVVQRVAPALTAEQIAARDAALERQRQEEEARLIRAEKDAELRQLYSSPDDAVRVMERQAGELLVVMQIESGKIEFSQKEIVSLEEKAAELERKGRSVPEKITQQIARLNSEIKNSGLEIEEREEDLERVLLEFDEVIRRLETITKKSAQTYEAVLSKIQEKKQSLK